MRKVAFLLSCFLAFSAGGAYAQSAMVMSGGCGTAGYTTIKGGAPPTQDTAGNGCVTSAQPATTVQGVLAVTTASAAISTLTLSPSSAAWAMPPPNGGMLTVKNNGDSTANIRVCWFGGTCTVGATSNGKAIEPGASSSVRLTGSTSPTVICDTAAACNISITE